MRNVRKVQFRERGWVIPRTRHNKVIPRANAHGKFFFRIKSL